MSELTIEGLKTLLETAEPIPFKGMTCQPESYSELKLRPEFKKLEKASYSIPPNPNIIGGIEVYSVDDQNYPIIEWSDRKEMFLFMNREDEGKYNLLRRIVPLDEKCVHGIWLRWDICYSCQK